MLAVSLGTVRPGGQPVVSVRAEPPDPYSSVLVQVRREGSPAEFVRVTGETPSFEARLPAVEAGRSLEYRVELVRDGRVLAMHPADGSWLTITEEPGTPYWAYDLRYIGSVTVVFRQEIIGPTPDGYHVNFFIETGSVIGPGIDATIRAEGADWLWIRRDGIAAIDVRATWETTDGALISYSSGGVIELGPEGYRDVVAGRLAGRPPFCCTIKLLTAHPRYEWLNRLQLLGFGRIDLDRLEIAYDVYTPEVKDRPGRA